jgi:uncharacterized peroxidase-related enzyme
MAHISLPEGIPGIVGPLMAYPETGKALSLLAELLLARETPTFSKAERETVANYVSFLNQCVFCSESHAAAADCHWKQPGLSKQVWEAPDKAPVSDRLKALLKIASKVQKTPANVPKQDIDAAMKLGATERDVHDTVLIAAAFCMFNRYVDGLATMQPPRGHESYTQSGQMLATVGYVNAIDEMRKRTR